MRPAAEERKLEQDANGRGLAVALSPADSVAVGNRPVDNPPLTTGEAATAGTGGSGTHHSDQGDAISRRAAADAWTLSPAQ